MKPDDLPPFKTPPKPSGESHQCEISPSKFSSDPSSVGVKNRELVTKLIRDMISFETRETAMEELSKQREVIEGLPLMLWYSFGIMAALLQEIIMVYPLLSPPKLDADASSRVCSALSLLQSIAACPETRKPFLDAQIPLYLLPLLNTSCRTRPFEYMRLTSLGVIGSLVKSNDSSAVAFLLSTEIIPLSLKIIETGNELSKAVAIFIVLKILNDKQGLSYICDVYERYHMLTTTLSNIIFQVVDKGSPKLLKSILRCYLRLSEDPKAQVILRNSLPVCLKGDSILQILKNDPSSIKCLEQLHKNLETKMIGLNDG